MLLLALAIEFLLYFLPTSRRQRIKRRRFKQIEDKIASFDPHSISYADQYWSDEEDDSAAGDPDVRYANLATQPFNLAGYCCL